MNATAIGTKEETEVNDEVDPTNDRDKSNQLTDEDAENDGFEEPRRLSCFRI